MPVPDSPKIIHIAHIDTLPSIIADAHLWCDAEIARRNPEGTTIGMDTIKKRRLNELHLSSHPQLYVGDCVPFYFCPRSIMLYLISRKNHPNLKYKDGQEAIIHLVADLRETVAWAEENTLRWAFTLSNAGAYYFEDRNDLGRLDEINWDAVQADYWTERKEGKQAEFLLEHRFPWQLVSHIGVISIDMNTRVTELLQGATHKPRVLTRPDWYY